MGHVFISYSHKDSKYAHALAAHLNEIGLKVWIDERLDYGAQWPLEIQKQLDGCDAFILVMTPRSFSSDWVQSELQRAKRKLKPIFPLLLEGDEPWLSVESTQYYDVRGGQFPDEKFYTALKRVSPATQTFSRVPRQQSQPQSVVSGTKPGRGWIIGGIGGGLVLFLLCAGIAAYLIFKELNPGPSAPVDEPTSTVSGELNGTAPTSTDQSPILVATEEINTDSAVPPTATPLPPTSTPTVTPRPDEIVDDRGTLMRLVDAGTFIMGSDNGEVNEGPAHNVDLDAYYIDAYEVTNADYAVCVSVGKCSLPAFNTLGGFITNYYDDPQYGRYPVVYVNWLQARTYCGWRNAQLPSEAQWEKAARSTNERTYPWGEAIDCGIANYGQCVGTTSPVGSYQNGRSPYGIYDLAGNVWEWVADWYSESYFGGSPLRNPMGPETGEYHILRGGSFFDGAAYQRSAFRNFEKPINYNWNIGFRCAKDAP